MRSTLLNTLTVVVPPVTACAGVAASPRALASTKPDRRAPRLALAEAFEVNSIGMSSGLRGKAPAGSARAQGETRTVRKKRTPLDHGRTFCRSRLTSSDVRKLSQMTGL